MQNIFQGDLLPGPVERRRANHNGQKQEGGIADQINNKENTDAIEKYFDGVHDPICHTNAASCFCRAFFRSIRYCRISLA